MRPATAADHSFLLGLFASARPELSLINLDDRQRQALIEMQFNAQRRQYDAAYPLAENNVILRDGFLIGRMLVDRRGRDFTLVDIALLPEYRNAGIGTSLIRTLLVEAADASKPVRLHVLKSNPALGLYERLGFSPVADDSMYVEMVCEPAS